MLTSPARAGREALDSWLRYSSRLNTSPDDDVLDADLGLGLGLGVLSVEEISVASTTGTVRQLAGSDVPARLEAALFQPALRRFQKIVARAVPPSQRRWVLGRPMTARSLHLEFLTPDDAALVLEAEAEAAYIEPVDASSAHRSAQRALVGLARTMQPAIADDEWLDYLCLQDLGLYDAEPVGLGDAEEMALEEMARECAQEHWGEVPPEDTPDFAAYESSVQEYLTTLRAMKARRPIPVGSAAVRACRAVAQSSKDSLRDLAGLARTMLELMAAWTAQHRMADGAICPFDTDSPMYDQAAPLDEWRILTMCPAQSSAIGALIEHRWNAGEERLMCDVTTCDPRRIIAGLTAQFLGDLVFWLVCDAPWSRLCR